MKISSTTSLYCAVIILQILSYRCSVAQNALIDTAVWSETSVVAPSSFGNTRPRIVLTNGNMPFVVWGNASKQIVYGSRWNGKTFDMAKQLNPMMTKPFIFDWASTEAASKDDLVYVTFKTDPAEKGKVYIVKSSDGGVNFSDTIRVENLGMDLSRFPSIGVDAMGNPVVTFMRFKMGFTKPDYVVSRSTDGGKTFLPDVPAGAAAPGEACDCCPAAIVSDGDRQAVLFRNNDNNKRNIWASISKDGGSNFSTVEEVDNTNWMINSCPSTGPDGIISGNTMTYTWMSQGTVYIGSSDLNGNIGIVKKIDDRASGLQNYPRIAGSGDTIAVVWKQYQNATGTANISWSTTGIAGIGENIDTIGLSGNVLDNPDIAYANGVFYTVYQDHGTKQVKYRKLTLQSPETSINEAERQLPSIMIYPNPSSADVIIKSGVESIGQSVAVHTILGKKVWESTVTTEQVRIPSGTLLPGIYIVETTSLQGIAVRQKLVIL